MSESFADDEESAEDGVLSGPELIKIGELKLKIFSRLSTGI